MEPQLLALAGGGVVGGLVLLGRGFGGYRDAARISDTAPSRVSSIAVGEVLVTGVVEPAELTLVSPLQSQACVFYRSTVIDSEGDVTRTSFEEERAVGFRVRDESGDVRVFPRDARFDVPNRFDEHDGTFGDRPAGLRPRNGPAYGPGVDREAQIAALLTVQPAGADPSRGGALSSVAGPTFGMARRRQTYREARIEPGETVTVVGRAMPFDQLDDPASANLANSADSLLADPEVSADIAAARAAGTLADDPEDAWGNAGIPGFGIGRPVRPPELDDGANRLPLAAPEDAAASEQTFAIRGDELILAASEELAMVISLGTPVAVAGRSQRQFLIGLLGAVVAIASAMAFAMMIGGQLG